MVLVYGTKVLNHEKFENMLLSDFGIQNNSTISMVTRLSGGKTIELKISLCNDQILFMNIEDSSTIEKLKMVICERNSVLMGTQMCLMHAGVKLDNEKKISDYKIKSGDFIT